MKLIRENDERPSITLTRSAAPSVAYGIITLNYDTLLEDFRDYINSSSLTQHPGDRIGFIEAPQESGAVVLSPLGPHLAKLHGSVKEGKIILPSYLKGRKDLPPSWVLAFKLLQEAHEVRIIGYSLPETDAYIKSLLHASLGQSRDIQTIDVVGVDDEAGSLRQKYENFINPSRLRFVPGTTEQYLEYNLNMTRSRTGESREMKFINLEEAHELFMRDKTR